MSIIILFLIVLIIAFLLYYFRDTYLHFLLLSNLSTSNTGIRGGDEEYDTTAFGEEAGYFTQDDTEEIAGGAESTKEMQARLGRQFRRLKPKKISFEDFCFPKFYKLQSQQLFLGEYFNNKLASSKRTILLFHKIGAGKTCASIQIAKNFMTPAMQAEGRKPLFLMPASLIPGFRDELRTPCGANKYVNPSDTTSIKKNSGDKNIDKDFKIHSYNSFLNYKPKKAPSIIIVDEVQNIYNRKGSFFKKINDMIHENPDVPVVIMSGTPFFDNSNEIQSIASLLRIDIEDDITPKRVEELFSGHVSFFAGAPAFTYPQVFVKKAILPMSSFQRSWYQKSVEAELKKNNDVKLHSIENDFYIKSRQKGNVVFPKGLTGRVGLEKLSAKKIKESLKTYSVKMAYVMKKLHGLSMIYTSFTNEYGILLIRKVLETYGFLDYMKHGPGKKRYAVWSGDESKIYKGKMRNIFNSMENDDASQIQVIIGSPAIKEGVSLFRLKNMFVMETYWNHSRLEQIYGRGNRFCSHKRLKKRDRKLNIYLLIATAEDLKKTNLIKSNITAMTSIDYYMLNIADQKRIEAEPYIKALMNCAIDKKIFYA